MEQRIHVAINLLVFHADWLNQVAPPYLLVTLSNLALYALHHYVSVVAQSPLAKRQLATNLFVAWCCSLAYQLCLTGWVQWWCRADWLYRLGICRGLVLFDMVEAHVKAEAPADIERDSMQTILLTVVMFAIYGGGFLPVYVDAVLGVLIVLVATMGARVMHRFV